MAGQPGVLAVLDGRVATPDDLTAALARAAGPAVVLVDDVEQLLDNPLAPALENLLRGARGQHRAVVVAGRIAELNAASFRGLVAEVKKSRAGLILSPGAVTDAELFGTRLSKSMLFTGPAGRAIQVSNGSPLLVQIADAGGGP
jgi:S-DNA-T family DNA segregation ATPase FtsK/SpoIIIE